MLVLIISIMNINDVVNTACNNTTNTTDNINPIHNNISKLHRVV